MKLRIRGGTPSEGQHSLCFSCRNAVRILGGRGEQIIRCNELYTSRGNADVPPSVVVECNRYKQEVAASLNDMKEISWVLRTEKGGSKIGFKPYKDLETSERFYLKEED